MTPPPQAKYKLALKIITCWLLSFMPYASADNASHKDTQVLWQRIGHEATSFGYSFDNNDENFIDIKISLKWSPSSDGIHPDQKNKTHTDNNKEPNYYCTYFGLKFGCLFLAFTTEQAFYLGTRDSSPVIGQRYNPEFFFRFWQKGGGLLDIGFNHESNGQSIDSQAEFNAKQQELLNTKDEGPSSAKEFLSRDWNYWELTFQSMRNIELRNFKQLTYTFIARYFVDGSVESYAFENNDKNLSRSNVDGLQIKAHLQGSCATKRHCWNKGIAYTYTTGYDNPFRNDSHQIEWSVLADNWPITLWLYEGYNEDLIDYYQRVKSVGIRFDVLSL